VPYLRESGNSVTQPPALPGVSIAVDSRRAINPRQSRGLPALQFPDALSYLKLSGKKVGLLVNFNVELLKYGITRMVN
jgi:hypothetical protein